MESLGLWHGANYHHATEMGELGQGRPVCLRHAVRVMLGHGLRGGGVVRAARASATDSTIARIDRRPIMMAAADRMRWCILTARSTGAELVSIVPAASRRHGGREGEGDD